MAGRRYDSTNDSFYKSQAWRQVRQLALERDLFVCQRCKRAGRIAKGETVHHIKPVRLDSKRALDLTNLETICRRCHNQSHTERTKKLSDKRQALDNQQRGDVIKLQANIEVW